MIFEAQLCLFWPQGIPDVWLIKVFCVCAIFKLAGSKIKKYNGNTKANRIFVLLLILHAVN